MSEDGCLDRRRLLRDMGLIEIKRPLSNIKKELEQLMNDPVLQTTKDFDETGNETTSETEPAWTRIVPSWVLTEDENENEDFRVYNGAYIDIDEYKRILVMTTNKISSQY